MQTKRNQALTMHPLFFDPIYSRVYVEEENGKRSLKYRDDIWGARLEENGDVTFSMYAPGPDRGGGRSGRQYGQGAYCLGQRGGRLLFQDRIGNRPGLSLSLLVCGRGAGDQSGGPGGLWLFWRHQFF